MPVPVRTLESLRRGGEIPNRAGVLKIDTEGFDLEVIRGMGTETSPVVMAEFWDARHSFGQSGKGRLEDLVNEMRQRGYHWHIVIYHLEEAATISYYCNQVRTVPNSWGNALFSTSRLFSLTPLAGVKECFRRRYTGNLFSRMAEIAPPRYREMGGSESPSIHSE